ncbi:MAG: hypothetical protein HFH91_02325 [Lachnospiraceae bacterium]|jgi:hypothetical protein|nr:hypothetical protein [Lachnospiraceae bacterium]
MTITSLDILNLSHSLKDICEVNCNTPECLSQTLKILMQYNLIQANLQFGRQFCTPPACPCGQNPSGSAAKAPTAPARNSSAPVVCAPTAPGKASSANCSAPAAPTGSSHAPSEAASPVDSAAPASTSRPPVRLDIGDPFLADYEK